MITIAIFSAVITDLSLLYLLKLPQALRYMKQQSPNQDIAEDLYQGLSELMNSVPLLDLVEIKLKWVSELSQLVYKNNVQCTGTLKSCLLKGNLKQFSKQRG